MTHRVIHVKLFLKNFIANQIDFSACLNLNIKIPLIKFDKSVENQI